MRGVKKLMAVITLILAIISGACQNVEYEVTRPELYSSSRLEARVVDATTGAPVSDAVVVAVWRKISNRVERWDGIYRFAETATDGDGRFVIHRWGPRPAPQFAFLDRRDPEIWILKNGYVVGYFDNDGAQAVVLPPGGTPAVTTFVKLPPNKIPNRRPGEYARGADGGSIWHGGNLMLERVRSAEEQARSLAIANPLDPHLPASLYPIPLFWAEWEATKLALPSELRSEVTFPPLTAVDYVVRSD